MRKTILSLGLALALCLGLAVPAFAAEKTSDVPSVTVETLIAPTYEDAHNFTDGYAAVKQNGKWGYIDETGKMVIQPKYDWAGEFREGVAVTAIRGEDVTYNEGTEWEYIEPHYYLYLVYPDGREVQLMMPDYGNYDAWTDGGENMPDVYGDTPAWAYSLDNTRTWFCQEGVLCVNGVAYRADGSQIKVTSGWDKLGENSWFGTYSCQGVCKDGIIPMSAYEPGWGDVDAVAPHFLMDKNGKVLQAFPNRDPAMGTNGEYGGVDDVSAPESGRIVASILKDVIYADEYSIERVNRYGAMDVNGNWVIQPIYESYRYFFSGQYFSDGLWTVSRGGKWGAVDVNGREVIPMEYDMLISFSSGLAAARKDGKWSYIDTANHSYQIGAPGGGIAGNIAIASHFSDHVAAVYDRSTKKAYCILDTPVNGVLPAIEGTEDLALSVYFPDYDGTGDPSELGTISGVGDIVVVQQNGKYGYLKLNFDLQGVNPFVDVMPAHWYFAPVQWAVDEEVTTGTTDDTFSPAKTCTQSEIITFLWRASGRPEPAGNSAPFDMPANAFYYKAVQWAYEKGIIDGSFDASAPCTRAQAMIFLWRHAGKPAASTSTGFSDVPASADCAQAVSWAVSEKITDGLTSTTFGPDDICTRGHIVTFLFRYIVGN